jgi:hypothetical protein
MTRDRTTVRAWHAVAAGALLASALIALMPQLYRAVPFTTPDSISYVEWIMGRTPGYPLFVRGVRLLSPSLGLIGPIQFVLFAAAVCWWTKRVEVFTRSRLLASAAGLATILHPQIVSYTHSVLPEALFVAGVLVLIGILMQLCERHSLPLTAAGAAVAGGLALLKPSAFGLTPALFVTIALVAPRRAPSILTAVATFTLLLAAGGLLTIARGGAGQSFSGYALIGVTGAFVQPDDVPQYAPLVQRANERLATVRAALRDTTSPVLYHFLSSAAYHTVSGVWVDVLETHLADERHVPKGSDEAFVAMNDLARTISAAAIRRHPDAYARHVAAQLYALWAVPFVRTPTEAAALAGRVEAEETQRPGAWPDRPAVRVVPAPVAIGLRLLLAAAFAISIVALIGLPWRHQSSAWRATTAMSVLVHGYFMLVALAQPGLPRYTLVAWPAILCIVVVPLSAALRARRSAIP